LPARADDTHQHHDHSADGNLGQGHAAWHDAFYKKLLRPDTKTLYMSGYPDMGEGSEALRSQPNFIQKPFTREMLLRRVREVLENNASDSASH